MFFMLRVDLEVPMRSRMNRNRHYADYKQAVGLLRHDLVWSSDLESIRQPLADLIEFHADAEYHPSALTDIVQKLIATDNDLTI
jgi:hypothetical protein